MNRIQVPQDSQIMKGNRLPKDPKEREVYVAAEPSQRQKGGGDLAMQRTAFKCFPFRAFEVEETAKPKHVWEDLEKIWACLSEDQQMQNLVGQAAKTGRGCLWKPWKPQEDALNLGGSRESLEAYRMAVSDHVCP